MLYYNRLWIIKCEFTKERKTIMEKLKKRIANLKVAGKLKLYRITVLVMTLFLMLVALISTLVIRSNIEKITEVDRKSTRLNSSHIPLSRMPSSA